MMSLSVTPENLPVIRTDAGLKISGKNIYLDPQLPVLNALISHAHGDHAIPGHNTVWCTYPTARLLRTRFQNFARNVITVKYFEEFNTGEGIFYFAPAGHMMGSAQIVWKVNEETIIYSGDYKRQEDTTCEAFQIVPCSTFITETTFASPGKKHPEPAEALIVLRNFKDMNFILGTYSSGKAQRITHLINIHLPEFRIMLHPKIYRYHKVYEEMGFKLGPYFPFQKQVFKKSKGNIYLVPPPVLQSYTTSPSFMRAMVSGWENLTNMYETGISISDHADWFDILKTIDETGAKNIITIHGDGNPLSEHLKLQGLNVISI